MATDVMSVAETDAPSLEQKMATTRIASHPNSHLAVRDMETCRTCVLRPCVEICPGGVYDYSEAEALDVQHCNCLECGSCKIVCEFDNIDWSYPPGGFGVEYSRG